MSRTQAMIAFALVLAASAPAIADDPKVDPKAKAREHIERATELHAAGQFTEALGELTLAFALDPDPQLLFAIGQVHVKLGHCTEAITFYERFLATKPRAEEAATVRQAIAKCNEAVTTKPVDVPVVVEPPPPQAIVVTTTAPWYTDWIGDALVGGGVVTWIASAVVYRSARSTRDDADDAATYEEYEDLLDKARGRRTLSVVVAAGGAALVTAGVLRYVLGDRRREERRLAIAPTAGGGFVTWDLRF